MEKTFGFAQADAQPEPIFKSFWIGGFEGADHVNSHGKPLHMNESSGHSRLYAKDCAGLAGLGIKSVQRGDALKCRPVEATVRGCDALWATEPHARIVHTDPLIHVATDACAPHPNQAEEWMQQAQAHTEWQFQAWDMLCGLREPGLCGAARCLDSVVASVEHAIAQGVPLLGVCLYPVLDRPDWKNPAQWHRSGLWEVRGHHSRSGDGIFGAAVTTHLARSVLPSVDAWPSQPLSGALDRVLYLPLAQQLERSACRLSGLTPSFAWGRSRAPPQAFGPASDFHSNPSDANTMSLPSTPQSNRLVESFNRQEVVSTLIVFSHLRWDFVYQRPQQLLSRIARHMPVLFIEEPIPGAAFPAMEVMDPELGVRVLRAHVTTHGGGFDNAHMHQMQTLLQAYLQEHAIEWYWLWFYTPMALPLAAPLTPKGIVYDCMDELSAFRFAPPELLQREDALFDQADLVFTGGFSLYEAKCARHASVHCLPSSVDATHFARAKQPGHADHVAQAHLAKNRLGYFGVIDERIDLDLIAEIADARSDWQVIMVGPVVKIDTASLPQRPNLHWMGQQDYAELPEFVGGWDVCLMPFALNESTRFISPTKTLEYLAAGRPVVSTPIRDVVMPYSGVVAIAHTAAEFVAACEAALARTPAQKEAEETAVKKLLSRTSWDGTALAMIELMDEHQGASQTSTPNDVSNANSKNAPMVSSSVAPAAF